MSSHVVSFPASRRARRLSLRAPLVAVFGRVAASLREAGHLRRERRYLEEMDERMLRDIGVSRAEIDAELRRPAGWGALLHRG